MAAIYQSGSEPTRRDWTRDELLVVLGFYCLTPFDQLDQGNSGVIELARFLNRTPGSVAMKAANFASLDPQHQRRGVSVPGGIAAADREVFDEFITAARWVDFWVEVAAASVRLEMEPSGPMIAEEYAEYIATGDTETRREVKVRLAQRSFRKVVMGSYDGQCAFCAIPEKKLLTASHIIPWAEDENRRVDPRNGIALCALHDRAFDRGLMSVDEDYRILVSPELLSVPTDSELFDVAFRRIEGSEMNQPSRFAPDPEALASHRARHRERLFIP